MEFLIAVGIMTVFLFALGIWADRSTKKEKERERLRHTTQ
jgi:hypothetical protein